MDETDRLHLKKRYLIWLYKTTKEAIDRVERAFTQLEVDRFILKRLRKLDKKKQVSGQIAAWAEYIRKKEVDSRSKRTPEHGFLVVKCAAIERAIVRESGKKALKEIKALYEREMTERILKSTEHS